MIRPCNRVALESRSVLRLNLIYRFVSIVGNCASRVEGGERSRPRYIGEYAGFNAETIVPDCDRYALGAKRFCVCVRELCGGISVSKDTNPVRKLLQIVCSLFNILSSPSVEERYALIRK